MNPEQILLPSSTYLATAPAVVKISLFLLIWGLVWLPIAIPVGKVVGWQPNQPLSSEQKLPLLASLYVIAPLIVWWFSKIYGDSWSDYGLSWQPELFLSLLMGIGLGIVSIILIFALETAFGWATWHGDNYGTLLSTAIPILALGLWVGITEELIFRGLFINLLNQDYVAWIGAIITSAIFAGLHLFWEQTETLPQLPGLWFMGMVLVLARWVDHGSLGLAWGLHAGWIWVLSSFDTAGVISYTSKSPGWITGFDDNPLAGIAGIICLCVTILCLLILYFSKNLLILHPLFI